MSCERARSPGTGARPVAGLLCPGEQFGFENYRAIVDLRAGHAIEKSLGRHLTQAPAAERWSS